MFIIKLFRNAHSCRDLQTLFRQCQFNNNNKNYFSAHVFFLFVFSNVRSFLHFKNSERAPAHRHAAFPVVTLKSQVNYSTFFSVQFLFCTFSHYVLFFALARIENKNNKSQAHTQTPNSCLYYLKMFSIKTIRKICSNSNTCHIQFCLRIGKMKD